MVKSYLKFEQTKSFGTICSSSANVLWDHRLVDDTLTGGTGTGTGTGTGRAFVPANEEVLSWDLKKSEILTRWRASGNKAQVSTISRSDAESDIFAVGYADGVIRIWDLQTATVIITFNGHKSSVTHLQFDRSGVRLASGSEDTDVILWDLVGEAGLFKLRGHKGQITSVNFLSGYTQQDSSVGVFNDIHGQTDQSQSEDFLVTTSKDSLIKVWDLTTQHCIETHVAQSNGECWALGLSPDKDGCITAGNDGELKAWTLNRGALRPSHDAQAGHRMPVLEERGTFHKQGRDRTREIKFHPIQDVFAVYGSEKAVEVWRVRSEDEARKALNRKRKRKREREKETTESANGDDTSMLLSVSDIFVPHVIVRTSGKVRSADWTSNKSLHTLSMLVATTNNQLELFHIQPMPNSNTSSNRTPDYSRSLSVDMPGHRTDVRCLALSSDDRMLASASQGSMKIWNVRTQSGIRTMDCGYALCMTFLPGDKIVVLGTREGSLEIFDIASSTLLDTISAHEKDVWSLQLHPDGKYLVTGSADKSVKFWELKVVQEEILGTSRKVPKLTLVHTRTLKVTDDVLSIRLSPDGRLLAVSTLDNTVKVFFVDSLKSFLTLYGHKLPVLSMDISYDSKLIVTSSADKNVRVWGLDFGDCHKTFFAHQDSILSVSFIPNDRDGNGHHFFSSSKDRVIKYYDGDKFEQIQVLEGHYGEVWAMVVAHSGGFLVSASHDKSIRIWEQTDEQIFLEEEREKELEDLFESTLLTSLEQDENATNGDSGDMIIAATRPTIETLIAGEKIAEALELAIDDLEMLQQYQQTTRTNPNARAPQRNPIFVANRNISASEYVYGVFQKIPATSLQDALLVLSFSQLPALVVFLTLWASEGRNVPLTCRILFFILKIHQKQVVSSKIMKGLIEGLKNKLRPTLETQRKELGFNLAGVRVVGRQLNDFEEHSYIDPYASDSNGAAKKTNTRKRGFVTTA